MSIGLIGSAIGGIGLFLLGMRLMTEGLKVAAGPMLRDILGRWTRTSLRGVLSGILVTGIVQSSSAVTVATIGFVNAGLLTLGQAMWVVFGSSVGTTMTGWIVATAGFDFRIEAIALPLVGIGMFLSLRGTETRGGALGEALAGFGIFFFGIAVLKTTFGGFGDAADVARFAVGGIAGAALFVGIGVVLTTLVQSSSAVIAIALTAVVGGVLPLEAGAALVIGANLGTATTALLAVIGATANAKRVAVSHVAFNALTSATALALLPLLVIVVAGSDDVLGLAGNPATALALFHTLFNLLGVLLIWPFARRFESWLGGRFVSREEDEARPRYLDRTAMGVPALAVDSMLLELERLARLAIGIARTGFSEAAPRIDMLERRREAIDRLSAAIGDYARGLNATKLSSDAAEAMAHPFRVMWHLAEVAERGLSAAARQRDIRTLPEHYRRALESFASLIVAELDAFLSSIGSKRAYSADREAEEAAYQRLKAELLTAASTGALETPQLSAALETLDDLHVTLRFLDRASRRLMAVAAVSRPSEEDGRTAGEA